MQKKTGMLLRGLLAIFLSLLVYGAIAEDSLTDFEQALQEAGWSVQRTNTGELLLMAPEQDTPDDTAPANINMKKLAKELEASGWKVRREADGTLVLEPREPEISQGTTPPRKDRWLEIQQKLQRAGWSAEREADGSLRLKPPVTAARVEPDVAVTDSEPGNESLFSGMQGRLRDSGWRVTHATDGSILLYPPGKPKSDKARPCPGSAPAVEVTLPVDNWQEAYDIARGWLDNQSISHASVGKIRKILNIYLISIVSSEAPYSLIQQVAIRNSEGTVMVLN